MNVMNSFMEDLFDRICTHATELVRYSNKATLSSREIQTSVLIILPGDLSKHAVSEGTSSLKKYTESKSSYA